MCEILSTRQTCGQWRIYGVSIFNRVVTALWRNWCVDSLQKYNKTNSVEEYSDTKDSWITLNLPVNLADSNGNNKLYKNSQNMQGKQSNCRYSLTESNNCTDIVINYYLTILAYCESWSAARLSSSSQLAEVLKNSTNSIGPRPIRLCEMPGNPTFSAPTTNQNVKTV